MQTQTKKSAVPFLSCSCGYIKRDGEMTNDFASRGNYSLLCSNKAVKSGKKDDVLIGEFELKHYSIPALMLGKIRKASEKCKTCEYYSEC